MMAVPHPDEVRQIVVRTFGELGVRRSGDVQETIRIDVGHLLARTYKLGRMSAVWEIRSGLLRFFDARHNLLRSINLLEELSPQRMAA
jgi:hypothetical protein